MTIHPSNILISGAGQLGSRYLQGLTKCKLPLRIYVHDKCEESLSHAKQCWAEMLELHVNHEVSYHTTLDALPRHIDICIVATTANSRPEVVSDITRKTRVRFWVLEKVLAQSRAGIDAIVSHVAPENTAWVNTPRRMIPWHQQIRNDFQLGGPLDVTITGGAWGLGCNSIHYLDLLKWWTGETLESVSTANLSSNWFESKRKGNWEIYGTLEASYSGGSRVTLSAEDIKKPVIFQISAENMSYSIDEASGVARSSDGIEILGIMPYQSEMSGTLVASILETRSCVLPGLIESAELHRIFVGSMLDHWKRTVDSSATFVPIT